MAPGKPTVGRIVHFLANDEPPQAALVIDDQPAGNEGGIIKVHVFTRNGGKFTAELPIDEHVRNMQGYAWCWPPRG